MDQNIYESVSPSFKILTSCHLDLSPADGGLVELAQGEGIPVTGGTWIASGTYTLNKSFIMINAVHHWSRFYFICLSLYLPDNKKLAGVGNVWGRAETITGYRSSSCYGTSGRLVGEGIGSNGGHLEGSEWKGHELSHHVLGKMNSVGVTTNIIYIMKASYFNSMAVGEWTKNKPIRIMIVSPRPRILLLCLFGLYSRLIQQKLIKYTWDLWFITIQFYAETSKRQKKKVRWAPRKGKSP